MSVTGEPSHPSWVCGLKHPIESNECPIDIVTPFVGVWIETNPTPAAGLGTESHPSWVCGLKLLAPAHNRRYFCHTLRGCVD